MDILNDIQMFKIISDSNQFIQFISQELMICPSKLGLDTNLRSIETWSSLNALILISRINEETDLTMSSSDLSKLITVNDLYLYLQKQVNN
jgi:acyl carrier protein